MPVRIDTSDGPVTHDEAIYWATDGRRIEILDADLNVVATYWPGTWRRASVVRPAAVEAA